MYVFYLYNFVLIFIPYPECNSICIGIPEKSRIGMVNPVVAIRFFLDRIYLVET